MHELSMAESILRAVLENSEKNNANKVLEVVIEVGKMAMLNSEQVQFMLDVLKEDTIAEDAKFIIEEIPIEIICDKCGFEGKLLDADLDPYTPHAECPECKNFKVKVTNGKDVIVKNIIIDKDE
jgi:hydrogenase nickel incorporation protein HypA/HybF